MSEIPSVSMAATADRVCPRDAGGFAPDMELFTPTGPVRVETLSVGDTVYALNPDTRMVKPKPVVAYDRVKPDARTVVIKNRSADLHVGAAQPIYYRTTKIDRARVVTARNVTDRVYYKFLNNWQAPPGQPLRTVDVTDLTSNYEARLWSEAHGSTVQAALPDGCEPTRHNSHTGYYFAPAVFKKYQDAIESVADTVEISGGANARGRPYRFDGTDFLRFLGWFVAEGSITWSKRKDSAEIKIAQKAARYRPTLRALFDRLGITIAVSSSGMSFSSTTYAELLERLCGSQSSDRHLPWFVWNVSRSQKRVLLDTLLAGDGDEHSTYYTTSKRLAFDVMRLATDLGFTPRYTYNRGVWRVYISTIHRGFRSDRHIQRRSVSTPFVQLAVRDFPAVFAGRGGTFQWVGVSQVV